jgi:hypothetical protein
MIDYDDILNRTWEDVPEPVLLPVGDWLIAGKNAALIKPTKEGQSLKVLFSYGAKSPVAVAEDLLEELGDYDITINDLTYTIYLESAADWDKVRKHLALHGVEMTGAILDDNGKLAFNKAFRGAEVVGQVGQRSYENADGDTIWQNSLSKFQAVTE